VTRATNEGRIDSSRDAAAEVLIANNEDELVALRHLLSQAIEKLLAKVRHS
jgi:hypothetical protein